MYSHCPELKGVEINGNLSLLCIWRSLVRKCASNCHKVTTMPWLLTLGWIWCSMYLVMYTRVCNICLCIHIIVSRSYFWMPWMDPDTLFRKLAKGIAKQGIFNQVNDISKWCCLADCSRTRVTKPNEGSFEISSSKWKVEAYLHHFLYNFEETGALDLPVFLLCLLILVTFAITAVLRFGSERRLLSRANCPYQKLRGLVTMSSFSGPSLSVFNWYVQLYSMGGSNLALPYVCHAWSGI